MVSFSSKFNIQIPKNISVSADAELLTTSNISGRVSQPSAVSTIETLAKPSIPIKVASYLKEKTPIGALAGGIKEAIEKKQITPLKTGIIEAGKRVEERLGEKSPEELAFSFMPVGKVAEISTPARKVIAGYSKKISTEIVPTTRIALGQKFNKFYEAMVDRFDPIVMRARKVIGLKPGESPELLARRYLGVKGIAESKLFWKTHSLTSDGGIKITGEGLQNIIKPVGKAVDDLRILLTAQREVELAERGIKGAVKEEADSVITALKNEYGGEFSKLENATAGIRDWTKRALLDPLKEIGALSDDVYNKIVTSNKFYTPFERVMGELEGGAVPTTKNVFAPKALPIKRIRGSEKQIVDPLETLVKNTYKITDFVERARVAQSVVRLRNLSDDLAKEIIPIKAPMKPVAMVEGETVFRPDYFTPQKNTIMVFEDGKRMLYKVPEDLYKAMTQMSEGGANFVMRLLSFPTKVLRAGATLTPDFIGRNPVRDQWTAFINSKYGYVPGVDLVKGMFETIGKKDIFRKWQAAGGDQSMFVSLDRLSNQKTFANLQARKLGTKIKQFKNPLEMLRAFSEFTEKGTRLGEFARGIKRGASELEAAFASREITLDFARAGNVGRQINKLNAFWNANVQDIDKIVRRFKEAPMTATVKAITSITLPSVSLYLLQKDNPRYQEIPQWQRDVYWNIVLPNDVILTIPKPFTLGTVFGTIPEHILDYAYRNDPESLTTIPQALATGTLPGWLPTIFLPIVEYQSNYNFFRDTPIVGQSIANLPEEMQSYTYNTETAKEIGKLINQSPAKLENLFIGYTAGLGRYGLQVSDILLDTLGVTSPMEKPSRGLEAVPLIRAFTEPAPSGSRSESVNKFYDLLDQAREANAGARELLKGGDKERTIQFIQNNKEIALFKGMEKVASTFSEIRNKIRQVESSPALNSEQKKKAIDALNNVMTEIARQTLTLIREVE